MENLMELDVLDENIDGKLIVLHPRRHLRNFTLRNPDLGIPSNLRNYLRNLRLWMRQTKK